MNALPDDALDRLPDEALVPVWYVREMLAKRGTVPFDGVGTAEASEITGIDDRRLRRKHRQWERESARGERPAIRVSRKSASDRSDLLFDRSDCYRYRRDHGGGPRVEAGDDELDVAADAIVDALLAEG